ncbi:MAG: hypothetical protein K0Q94_6598 [Paenibacillus sp.]|nr:hypothetical protein [Paenibacillus sp.]
MKQQRIQAARPCKKGLASLAAVRTDRAGRLRDEPVPERRQTAGGRFALRLIAISYMMLKKNVIRADLKSNDKAR